MRSTPRDGGLALTFGTLLSAQGTDAHRPGSLDPSRGNRATLCQTVAQVKDLLSVVHAHRRSLLPAPVLAGGRGRAYTSKRALPATQHEPSARQQVRRT